MRWLRALEPLWWGLFGIGGTLAALLLPVHVFLNNIAVPLGWVTSEATSYQTAARLIGNPLVKVYLIAFLAPTFFHAAHRLSFLPHELLLPLPRPLVAAAGYTGAAVLALVTIVLVALAP